MIGSLAAAGQGFGFSFFAVVIGNITNDLEENVGAATKDALINIAILVS